MKRPESNRLLPAFLFALLVMNFTPLAQAQVVITQDTTIDTGDTTYENESIIVESGTLTVNGSHHFESLILKTGSTLTHSANSSTQTWTLDVTVTHDLGIEPGASINVDGKGYGGSSGPGRGTDENGYAGGAGHAGRGGNSSRVNGGAAYGSLTEPVEIGSGGGRATYWNTSGGSGGGAVRLNVSGTLALEGTISANGLDGRTNSDTSTSGGGSGGSIYLTVGTLTGSGSISANGGSTSQYGGGGSGGRIAIYYDASSFTGATTARGGSGYNSGGAGTIYRQSSSEPLGDVIFDQSGTSAAETTLSGTFDDLYVYENANVKLQGPTTIRNLTLGQNAVLTQEGEVTITNLILTSGTSSTYWNNAQGQATITNLTLEAGTTLAEQGPVTIADLTLKAGSTLTHRANGSTQAWTLDVTVTHDLVIESGASINVDGKGYGGSSGPGRGTDENGYAGGAGHAGRGGNSSRVNGGEAYGSLTEPVEIGSCGGRATYWNTPGGSGGGAVRLNVSGTLALEGTISANGLDGRTNSDTSTSGGGSGGSIYVTVGTLTGSGSISANGGNTSQYGGGGSGGRVAIYYDASSFTGGTAARGGSGYNSGGAGTLYRKSSSEPTGDVIFDQSGNSAGENTLSGTFDNLQINDNANVKLQGPTSIENLTLGQGVTLTQEGEVHVTYLTLTAGAYSINWSDAQGRASITNMTLEPGAALSQQGPLTITDLILRTGSTLTHRANGTTQAWTLDLTITHDLVIESGASITVDGKGYGGSNGPGKGTDENGYAGGAGHAGRGGNSSRVSGGAAYGSLTEPVEIGSGGGRATYRNTPGGAGGGAVRLNVSGTLALEGTISANGLDGHTNSDTSTSGGGSGGSIYLTVGTLTGNGSISANGGITSQYGGGGSGGRIAIYHTGDISGFNLANVIALGGTGYQNGSDGSIYIPVVANPVITTHNGTDFVTGNQALTLQGTCLAGTDSIWVNGSQDGVTYTPGTTSWSFQTTLVEGYNTFAVTAKDAVLNESGPARIIVTLDRTPPGAPVITTNGGGDFTAQNAQLTLEGTCPEDTDRILVNGSEEGVTYTPGSTTWSFSIELPIGPNFFSVTAMDAFGNESPADTITVLFENSTPARPTNISPAASATNVLPAATLSASPFSDPDAGDTHSQSQWQVRPASSAYSDPVFESGYDAGHLTQITLPWATLEFGATYFWHVRYRDSKGTWSDYSEETSFTVLNDTAPPETVITSGPAENQTIFVNTATFAWSSTDNVQWNLLYATRLDDGPWSDFAAATSLTLSDLPDGTHTFSVVARDYSGNEDPTPAIRTFVVRTVPEEVTNVQVQCFDTSLVFTWTPSADSAGDLAGYRVYFDNATQGTSLAPSVTTYEVTGLAPATAHTFRVTAFKASGAESSGVTINAVTLLANPTNVAIAPYNGRVSLTWTEAQPSNYVHHYALYASDADFTSVEGMTPKLTVTGTSAGLAGLTNEVTYYFAVTTVNLSGGENKDVVTIPAAPQTDTYGPVISNVRVNGTPLVSGATLGTPSTFTLTATDDSGVSLAQFALDGVLFRTDTNGSTQYSATLDITQVADGAHSLTITAVDTLGNSTSVDYTLLVALTPPSAPVITSPSAGTTVNNSAISVAGRADLNTEVLLHNNGVQAGSAVAVDRNSNFSISIILAEGENRITAYASNRGGVSPASAVVPVILDSTLPQAPANLMAQSKSGGAIGLTWRATTESSPKGYFLYRASSPFSSQTEATRLNGAPVTATSFDDLPTADGTYYYRVTAVDRADNESAPSNLASAASDRTPPRAVWIQYTPSGPNDPATGRIAAGLVGVRLITSEPLLTAPFCSITPNAGVPIPVELTKSSDTEYAGSFVISDSTPSGTAYAVFSGRDGVGNRGTEIEAGGAITIDTSGPSVSHLTIQPSQPVKNDQQEPVSLTVTVGLNEAVKSGTTPSLSFLLSAQGRTPVSIQDLSAIAALPGHVQSYRGTFVLPADAGLAEVENLQFVYRGVDDLDNVSTRVLCENRFQVYQGDLPPLDPPQGFSGRALPQGRIRLSWQQVEGAAGYQLYRKAPGAADLAAYQRVGSVVELLDEPTVDGLYTYAIASIRLENGQEGVSAMSTPIQVSSDSVPPDAPQNLALTLVSQGIQAVWQAPQVAEGLTYSLYRADLPEIASVEGLTPVITGILETSAIDSKPSASDHCYVVTAVDEAGNISMPSNSFYLNFGLLPVSSLKVVQQESAPPVISWTAPSGSAPGAISGYNVTLGGTGQPVRLNQTLVTGLSLTDGGYSGDERSYTVTAVDDNGVESLGRSITLPALRATIEEGQELKRGIMNRLEFQVENSSSARVEHARLRVLAGSYQHSSEELAVDAGASRVVSVTVGGYADLPDLVTLTSTLSITPNDGELVEITRSSDMAVGDGMLLLQVLNESFTRGATGKVQFTLTNTSEEPIEIVTATGSGGSASNEITFTLLDADGNVLSSKPYRQSLGENIVTLANGKTIARIAAGAVFTSDSVELSVPLSAPDQVTVQVGIAKVHYHLGSTEQVSMEGLSTRQPVSLLDTSYFGEVLNVTPAVSNGSENIVITGRAVERASSLPMPNAPLNLVITVNGFERANKIFTDENGAFSYTFTPLSGESGVYTVRAMHPDVLDKPVQAQFTINRVMIQPQVINLSVPFNYEQTVPIQVTAGDGTVLHNLRLVCNPSDQPEGELPQGVHLTAMNPVLFLHPRG